MQEEHRQLLLEMETLRTRAAELTRLNAQRQQVRQAAGEAEALQEPAATQEEAPTQSDSTHAPPADPVPSQSPEPNQEETSTSDEDKEETASYLQEKLNEIANLKAQFKRVQHMVDTTKLIEKHISTRETSQSSSSSQSSRQTTTSEVRVPVQEQESAPSESPSGSSSTAPDNAELLNAMLNMFTDFTSDLRGQAESLRAERDRIRTLKEEIIQRKQGK